MKKKLLISLAILLLLYSGWSWILVNPNLFFTSWSPYVTAQTWLQETVAPNHQLVVSLYLGLIILLFINYIALADKLTDKRKDWPWLIIAIIPLLFAYNALSSDVFNYLFNAKMVTVYHDNPHIHTAMDYANDDWTRFMHNVHTPAPYGYGWTAASLIPFWLSGGKFSAAWLVFRLVNVGLLGATTISLLYFRRQLEIKNNPTLIFWWLVNPLVLIELIANIHNDLWMMLPALWSLYLVYPRARKLSKKRIVLAIILFLFSLSCKYATLALMPAWLFLLINNFNTQIYVAMNKWNKSATKLVKKMAIIINNYFFDWCALLMFLPLLTARSQRFHPWYLTWSLVFLPLTKNEITKTSLVILSLSAMLRYVPWLWTGDYTPTVLWQQQIVALMPVMIYWIWMIAKSWQHRKNKVE